MTLPALGFIGTGTLTTALVTGFCERAADKPYKIIVSPRNRDNSKMLQEKYPDRVTVAESMQDVLDQAEWIMIAILPDAGEEVLKGLQFRKEHKVINFMSDKLLPDIRSWIGDTEVLVHMVPLTYNAAFDGPIVLSPP
ncbi:MAG: NAD(P)-binding domain-containing protein, partial [Lachnospiraceae bacterium]|nr:NAD(P)-binding domain-containing protein [Lachnospiraceae bacterium]